MCKNEVSAVFLLFVAPTMHHPLRPGGSRVTPTSQLTGVGGLGYIPVVP